MKLLRLLPLLVVALGALALTGCDPAPTNEATNTPPAVSASGTEPTPSKNPTSAATTDAPR